MMIVTVSPRVWVRSLSRMRMKLGGLTVSNGFYTVIPCMLPHFNSNTIRRSTIHQRMGRPKPGRDTGTHQFPYQTHCWAYKKSTRNDSSLYVGSFHTTPVSRQHDYASVTHLTRVRDLPSDIPRTRHLTCPDPSTPLVQPTHTPNSHQW